MAKVGYHFCDEVTLHATPSQPTEVRDPWVGSEGVRHHVVRGLHGKEWWVNSRS